MTSPKIWQYKVLKLKIKSTKFLLSITKYVFFHHNKKQIPPVHFLHQKGTYEETSAIETMGTMNT